MKIRNYLFHRVSNERNKLWDPMDPVLFEKCIQHITSHYNVCFLEDLYLSKAPLNSIKPIATVTFDDGYKDNIEYALPILKKYSCPASFYVVTDCIDQNIPTWTFVLEYLFEHTKKLSLAINTIEFPLGFRKTNWKNSEERVGYAKALKPFLKKIPNEKREAFLEEINRQFNDVSLPKLMMNWDDLRAIHNDGFKVGSHSLTHPLLASISNQERLKNELNLSRNKIEKELGEKPVAISYPIGSYDDNVIELSKEAGYQLGLAVGQVFDEFTTSNLFEINRVELYNESWIKTKLRLSGNLELIKKILRK